MTTTDNIKQLRGTIQPCRIKGEEAAFTVLEEVPPAPDWLPNPDAVKEWNRCCELMMVNKLLTAECLSALGHLCAQHGSITKLYRAGMTPPASQIQSLTACYKEFGMTPLSFSKAHKATMPADKKVNRFARNGQRNTG